MEELIVGLVMGMLVLGLYLAGVRILLHLFPWMAIDTERDEDDPYPGSM